LRTIAWYARDAHVDLWPHVAKALGELGAPFHSEFVCHHAIEAERLRAEHGVRTPVVLADALAQRRAEVDVSDTALRRLVDTYRDLPLGRVLWGERFELHRSEAERQANLARHLDFWEWFLADRRVDVLVTERPSILSTSAAWLVCRRRGTRFVSLIDIPIDPRMVISSSWEGHYDGLEARLADSRPALARPGGALATSYIRRMRTRPEKTAEARVAMERSRRGVRADFTLARHLRRVPAVWRRARRRNAYYLNQTLTSALRCWVRGWVNSRLHRIVDVFDRTLDATADRFLLMPLHRDGEWSDYAWMGLGYADQTATVARVAACLPPGWQLYVKEHTGGFGERPPRFYRRLARIPGVRLVDPFADTFALLRRADGVVTLGSTMGFEAFLLGKPVVLLGRPWYGQFPGCYAAETPERLAELLHGIERLRVATEEETLRAVSAVIEASFEGVKPPHADALAPGNVRRIARAFREYLDASPAPGVWPAARPALADA
jgi:hypothetical protein